MVLVLIWYRATLSIVNTNRYLIRTLVQYLTYGVCVTMNTLSTSSTFNISRRDSHQLAEQNSIVTVKSFRLSKSIICSPPIDIPPGQYFNFPFQGSTDAFTSRALLIPAIHGLYFISSLITHTYIGRRYAPGENKSSFR